SYITPPPPRPPLFPYTTLFRSSHEFTTRVHCPASFSDGEAGHCVGLLVNGLELGNAGLQEYFSVVPRVSSFAPFSQKVSLLASTDRKSTRLNSSHVSISYAVFC